MSSDRTPVAAAALPIVEIADPEVVPFVSFDRVFLTYTELRRIFEDLYVGRADGGERIYGHWSADARNGHGDNVELKRLRRTDPTYCSRFVYSLLRVFGPEATQETLNSSESQYKRCCCRGFRTAQRELTGPSIPRLFAIRSQI